MKSKRLFRLVILDLSLIFSLTCLFVATAAWYSAQRQTNLTVGNITMEKGMTASLKYYTGNYSSDEGAYSGFKNPGALKESETAKTVTDYSTQFVPDTHVADNTSNPFYFEDVFPDTRFFFSVEVVSDFSYTSTISLKIDDYLSPESETLINKDTNKGISMGEAIDVYSSVFIYSDNTSATTQANNLISFASGGTAYTDDFTFENATTAQPTVFSLNSIDIAPSQTAIFLFMVEFSNQPNTFYRFDSRSGSLTYYSKDSTNSQGGSNVYQSLTFSINDIIVTRDS